MYKSLKPILQSELKKIHDSGLHKSERIITSRQGRKIQSGGKEVLNFCANNYLGLSGSDEMIASAKEALDKYGFGLSSVRFICGTQDIHKELEKKNCRIYWHARRDFIFLMHDGEYWFFCKLSYR